MMHSRRPDKRNRSRLRVALFHHITNEPSPFYDDLQVSISPAEFERQIRYFQKNYDIVSLGDVLGGQLPRRPLLLTFDDAYRSVAEVAAPLLSRLRLPALYLISAGHVDGKVLMNDHVLCYLSHTVGLNKLETAITGARPRCASVRELIDKVVSSLNYGSQVGLSAELVRRYEVPAQALSSLRRLYLTRAQVHQLPSQGIEVGNHTYSHVFCRHLDLASEELEILQAKHSLEGWTDKKIRAFSIPYGHSTDLTAHSSQILTQSGHEIIFTANSRRNPRGHQGPIFDRVNMRDCSRIGVWVWFELLPSLRLIRHRRERARR
jgi:peptidoglycan/xylan/chitin deacetylase (PgdA/CDA1 family)